MSFTVGIDLGTTYSVIAYIDPLTKKPIIIKNRYGNSTTPSAIGFYPNGTYVIGEDAKTMEEACDVNTASFYKLHMGDHSYKIKIYGKEYTAMELSALFLKRLVEDAESTIGEKIQDAVITVPAYFEEASKNDTIKAGELAGLNVINIISEPTAACVAYGLNEGSGDKKILIYDLGGGTFDVTIAQVSKESIDVLGTNGHHQLVGRDWDSALCEWMTTKVRKFQEEYNGLYITYKDDNELQNKIEQQLKLFILKFAYSNIRQIPICSVPFAYQEDQSDRETILDACEITFCARTGKIFIMGNYNSLKEFLAQGGKLNFISSDNIELNYDDNGEHLTNVNNSAKALLNLHSLFSRNVVCKRLQKAPNVSMLKVLSKSKKSFIDVKFNFQNGLQTRHPLFTLNQGNPFYDIFDKELRTLWDISEEIDLKELIIG